MLASALRTPLRSLLRTASPTTRMSSSSSSAPHVPLLLTPSALAKLLDSPTPPCVVDASWFMPNLDPPRAAFKEFKTKRIPGAAFWDLDIIASSDNPKGLPHMLPDAEKFADAASRLGISRDSHVVVYDTTSVFSSPRAAYTFKAFGHPKVSILDGGLPRWIAESHPIDTELPGHPNPHSEGFKRAEYGPILSVLLYDSRPGIESYFIQDVEDNGIKAYEVPELDPAFVRSWEQVADNSELAGSAASEVTLDARPAARFTGEAAEPRAGLSSGHIPHSLSLPFTSLLSAPSTTEPSYRTLLAAADLEKVFASTIGDDWEKVKKGTKGVIATCGSGMTAAMVGLGLEVVGAKSGFGLYDESWTGYAANPKSKIDKSK